MAVNDRRYMAIDNRRCGRADCPRYGENGDH